jgi:hypothetical protein
MRCEFLIVGVVVGAVLFVPPCRAGAGEAKGTLSYKGTTVTLKHAYLVKGPDAVDTTTIIRRLILSTADLEGKIKACKTMSCADREVTEGMTVELDGGPRLNYWVALKDGLLQYSGTEKIAALKTRTDAPGTLAGTLSLNATSADRPKVEVEFDAAMLKEFDAAR